MTSNHSTVRMKWAYVLSCASFAAQRPEHGQAARRLQVQPAGTKRELSRHGGSIACRGRRHVHRMTSCRDQVQHAHTSVSSCSGLLRSPLAQDPCIGVTQPYFVAHQIGGEAESEAQQTCKGAGAPSMIAEQPWHQRRPKQTLKLPGRCCLPSWWRLLGHLQHRSAS